MTYLDELKGFALLHARAQGIHERTTRAVLARVDSDDAGQPGSWTAEWCVAADRARARGRHLAASALYGLARFPFVDGLAREQAHRRSVVSFERWRERRADTVRRMVHTPAGSFAYYGAGLERAATTPALVVVGGIISTKEQWAPLLAMSRRERLPIVVTELPGVGENTVRYTPESASQLSDLLDDVGACRGAYVLAMSFGGHLALRCAARDPRIRGVATVGAPIDAFFRDPCFEQRVPLLTRRTLGHVTGLEERDVAQAAPRFALGEEELTGLQIPVHYIASSRDEVVPFADAIAVAQRLSNSSVVEFDDVHGSPNHVREVRASLALAIMRMRGLSGMRPRILEAFLRLRGVVAAPAFR